MGISFLLKRKLKLLITTYQKYLGDLSKKMKENRKVIKAVSQAVAKSEREIASLKAKSQKAIKTVKKEWKDAEPKRQAMKAKTTKLIKKIESKGKSIVKGSVQLEKDIAKGIKLGLRNGKKR